MTASRTTIGADTAKETSKARASTSGSRPTPANAATSSTERALTDRWAGAEYAPGVESTWYDTLTESALARLRPSPGSGDLENHEPGAAAAGVAGGAQGAVRQLLDG